MSEEFEVQAQGEEFEAQEETPKIVVKYGDNEHTFEGELKLDDLLALAREWGIRRFRTDPPLTRNDFPITESKEITLIPTDKAGQ